MRRSFRVVAVTLSQLLVAGCSDRLGPQLTIAAPSLTYVVRAAGGPFVSVTIRNVSLRSVQLAACAGTDVLPLRERLESGAWTDAPLATCVASFQPRELGPGETFTTASFNFFAATGTYRFRAPLFRDSQSVQPSRDVSPTITIH